MEMLVDDLDQVLKYTYICMYMPLQALYALAINTPNAFKILRSISVSSSPSVPHSVTCERDSKPVLPPLEGVTTSQGDPLVRLHLLI